jgi:hypothetical protein
VILSAFPYERLKRWLGNPRFSAGGFGSFTLSRGRDESRIALLWGTARIVPSF